MAREFSITSGDYALPARLHLPGDEPAAAYVLHPATGVPWDYYRPFAEWLAEQGFAVLQYGYRRDGRAPAALRRSRISMSDWGIADQNAALNALAERLPGVELRAIGHSLGGFMTMFHDRAHELASLTAVCSGPAYWRRTPWPQRLGVWAYWYVLGPAAVALLGYLPGRLLGGSEDIPAPAFREWKRWCTNPDLHRPEWGRTLPMPREDAFRGRLNLVAARDDTIIPPEVVRDLARFYPAARAEFHVAEADKGPIGHLSIFRPRNAHHWPRLL